MGLRFRKSITLCKGVKLNFGKTGMSVTTGVRGFHNTYNFGTGRTTTSVGIPGTGISYVTTSGGSRNGTNRRSENVNRQANLPPAQGAARRNEPIREEFDSPRLNYVPDDAFIAEPHQNSTRLIPAERIKTIHYSTDELVDWTEMLISDRPPLDCDNPEFWQYCHDRAYKILNGDIDTYLEVIQDTNPLDDLLEYGFGFECGTDSPNMMTVEFNSKQDELLPRTNDMSRVEYFDTLQDYICSCSIRIARDMFALLPVSFVIVHAKADGNTVLSVKFDRRTFMKMKFQGSDASDFVCRFTNNMDFNPTTGFAPVAQIEE